MEPSAPPFDRLLLVSYQPEKARAARQLADGIVRGLAKLKVREGILVAALDELVGGADAVVADVPFLPPEPVALCVTGDPRMVASVRLGILAGTRSRFVARRPGHDVGCLRPCVLVRDGSVVLTLDRELGEKHVGKLAAAGWKVATQSGEEIDESFFLAEELLSRWSGMAPTPWVAGRR